MPAPPQAMPQAEVANEPADLAICGGCERASPSQALVLSQRDGIDKQVNYLLTTLGGLPAILLSSRQP